MEEICGCMDSVISRMTPRLLTWSERGMSVLSSWRLEVRTEESFDLVPVSMASILSLFKRSLFSVIQFLMSEKHSVIELRREFMVSGVALSYSSVSSAKE